MSSGSNSVDHFPSTHRTWLMTQIDGGLDAQQTGDDSAHLAAIRAISYHVMDRYRAPLCAYVRGSRWKSFGDADDLVAGFFARRLDSLAYLQRWKDVGVPLRRWLMNGMLLELRTLARDQRRQSARENSVDPEHATSDPELSHDPQAERAFDRAWARGVLADAAALTAEELTSEGRETSWRIFERHILDGIDYSTAAQEVGVPANEARAMSRMAAYRLKRALRAVLEEEGIAEADLDRAVEDVYAAALGN